MWTFGSLKALAGFSGKQKRNKQRVHCMHSMLYQCFDKLEFNNWTCLYEIQVYLE